MPCSAPQPVTPCVLHSASQRSVPSQLHPVCSPKVKAAAKLGNVSTERWNLPLLHLKYKLDY